MTDYPLPSGLSYEDAIKRLEEIVTVLERGEGTLDQSMNLFREGVALSSFCAEQLNAMKEEMRILVDQTGRTEPFPEE
ncbi:MAG TPA: exodeoxyribonuclease VII small subunit [Bacillota bacterium]|nr:exodeoxyribonuclease VII small subunit [Bacillota bacterium]